MPLNASTWKKTTNHYSPSKSRLEGEEGTGSTMLLSKSPTRLRLARQTTTSCAPRVLQLAVKIHENRCKKGNVVSLQIQSNSINRNEFKARNKNR
jgi:hypothetical protein